MLWLRRIVVLFLSFLLFIYLYSAVLTFSVNMAVAKPANIEKWLSQSGVYQGFVDNMIDQANKDGSSSSGDVNLSDPAVQAIAKSVFSPALLSQNVKIFLDGNYAWLQGKTSTPQFVVDLTAAKQSFAQQVGQAVTAHLTPLPQCSDAQTVAAVNQDPLTLTCRPANLSAEAAGAAVTQKLAGSDGFLSNPIFTASNLNPKNEGQQPSQPYYQKLSFAPKAYKAMTVAPWALTGLAILCIIGIFFIAPTKRRGIRRLGVIFLVVGILLVVAKIAVDITFNRVEQKVFNDDTAGVLQQSLTKFGHSLESQIVNTNLYFGIGFLLIALIIFIAFMITRNKTPKVHESVHKDVAPEESESVTPKPTQKARPPKRPRLIQ